MGKSYILTRPSIQLFGPPSRYEIMTLLNTTPGGIMVTQEEHYQFLQKRYLAKRFEGRNGNGWGNDYSRNIAAHHYKDLEDFGFSLIGRHESANCECVIYDADLKLLESIPKREG